MGVSSKAVAAKNFAPELENLSAKMSSPDTTRGIIIRGAISLAATLVTLWFVRDLIEPNRKQRREQKERARKKLASLGVTIAPNTLTEHEIVIANNLIEPSGSGVKFSDIGGLQTQVDLLHSTVILPLMHAGMLGNSPLLQHPTGVLLYGPPGCGKTMLAKALANEVGARFINLQLSTLLDKWYGESEKLTDAVFSLARKIQPCILFIDEIDALLRERSKQDHEATSMMKSQFLSQLDGITTAVNSRIVLIGATNRKQDLDAAILRRLPCAIFIGLPTAQQRRPILEKILVGTAVAADVDIDWLASDITKGMSGADLHEFCRLAALNSLKRQYSELLRNGKVADGSEVDASASGASESRKPPVKLQNCVIELNRSDFEKAVGSSSSQSSQAARGFTMGSDLQARGDFGSNSINNAPGVNMPQCFTKFMLHNNIPSPDPD